ncbi:MAG TPA: regulatory protein GemA [Fluviicoccus sp.]|nr:regulatory protein GemA [Fluviicoccus sp.]
MTRQSSADRRQQLIRLIHVGKRELSLDEETYRALVKSGSKTTHDSTSLLTAAQLELVLDAMKARGFVVKTGGKPVANTMKDPQAQKIRALWLELHTRGYVNNPGDAALHAYIKRITRVERMEWLSSAQASQAIETLKSWLDRDFNKITNLKIVLETEGKLPVQSIDQLCMSVTGSHELNQQNAKAVIAYLEGI